MLQVTVEVGRGLDKQEHIVVVHGFDRLTPRAARAALAIATGRSYGGTVWWLPSSDAEQGTDYGQMYGYRVYKNSSRKLCPESIS